MKRIGIFYLHDWGN